MIFISRRQLTDFIKETAAKIIKDKVMTTIGQALNTVLATQRVHSAKLEAIHTAVLAIETGGGSEEQLALLRQILDAVTIPGEPEASPELLAIVERAVATAVTTRALADQLKALTEGD